MSMPEMETMGLSATVARASVLSSDSSQAQLLLQLLNVRQVTHRFPLDAHCGSEYCDSGITGSSALCSFASELCIQAVSAGEAA